MREKDNGASRKESETNTRETQLFATAKLQDYPDSVETDLLCRLLDMGSSDSSTLTDMKEAARNLVAMVRQKDEMYHSQELMYYHRLRKQGIRANEKIRQLRDELHRRETEIAVEKARSDIPYVFTALVSAGAILISVGATYHASGDKLGFVWPFYVAGLVLALASIYFGLRHYRKHGHERLPSRMWRKEDE